LKRNRRGRKRKSTARERNGRPQRQAENPRQVTRGSAMGVVEDEGFIGVTERGRGGNAEHRQPNLFFLTFAHARNSRAEPPTHDWRKIKTVSCPR
jgi:hypothetical protein